MDDFFATGFVVDISTVCLLQWRWWWFNQTIACCMCVLTKKKRSSYVLASQDILAIELMQSQLEVWSLLGAWLLLEVQSLLGVWLLLEVQSLLGAWLLLEVQSLLGCGYYWRCSRC